MSATETPVRELGHWIGGEWTEPGETFDDLDPFTGDAVARIAAAGRDAMRHTAWANARSLALSASRRANCAVSRSSGDVGMRSSALIASSALSSTTSGPDCCPRAPGVRFAAGGPGRVRNTP